MNKLKNYLKPLKRKMIFNNCLNYALVCFGVSMVFSIILIIISKFTNVNMGVTIFSKYIYGNDVIILIAGLLTLSSIFLGILLAFLKKPSYKDVAIEGDKLGYKERFLTGFEILEEKDESPASMLVINDAIEKASTANFAKNYKLKVKKRRMQILASLVIAVLIATMFPTMNKASSKISNDFKDSIEKEIKAIETATEKIVEKVDTEDAKKIKIKINELKKELRKANDETEAIKAMQKSQQELKDISKKSVPKALKELSKVLSSHEETAALGHAIENGNFEELEEKARLTSEMLKNADAKTKELFKEIYKEAAKKLADNPELYELLSNYSEALENSDLNELSTAYDDLQEQIEEMMAEDAEFREALEALEKSLAESLGSLNGSKKKTSKYSKSSSSSSKPGQSTLGNPSENESEGQESQGESKSSGEGTAGNQEGTPGNQEGTGQGNSNASGNGNGGTGNSPGGEGRGKGHIENNNVYVRDAAGKIDTQVNVTGEMNEESGKTTKQEVKGEGERGQSISYEEVLGEYKSKELEQLEEYEIPHGMKELVKDYFSTLE